MEENLSIPGPSARRLPTRTGDGPSFFTQSRRIDAIVEALRSKSIDIHVRKLNFVIPFGAGFVLFDWNGFANDFKKAFVEYARDKKYGRDPGLTGSAYEVALVCGNIEPGSSHWIIGHILDLLLDLNP